jgi:hypothetical protein
VARRNEIFGVDANLVFLGALGVGAFLLFGKQITAGVVSGAASVVRDVATGAVIGVADAVGIPETDANKCEAAIAAGNYWDASFYCPAGKFLKSATGAIYDTVTGAVVGTSAATGRNEIISISPQIPGEFGGDLPGAQPFEGAPNISDYPAA